MVTWLSATLTITLECFLCLCEAVIESYTCMGDSVSHSKHYTTMFSVLVWGYSWILFMHGWFCSIRLIHLIGRKSLYFENKTTVMDTGYPRWEMAVYNLALACSPVAIKYCLGQAIFLLDLFSPNFERLEVVWILASDPAWFLNLKYYWRENK